jgi:peptidoglycan-N-acetylglucosamine deacetylase
LGFYLPVISRGSTGRQAVALTFDDGPDPVSTPELLRLLADYKVTATFFVIGEKAAGHPDLIREIILQGHTIGNHSFTHDPLLLFRSNRQIFREIEKTQQIIRNCGKTALVFRPPMGITGPGLYAVLRQLDLYTVNFSCRAFDGGNRHIGHLSKKILNRVKPDDIILLHDSLPRDDHRFSCWLKEMNRLLSGLEKKDIKVLPLSVLIGKTVMK